MLAAQVDWKGHACFVAGGDPCSLLRLAAVQASKDGVLLGWLDEMSGGATNWLRLMPGEAARGDYVAASEELLFSAGSDNLRLDKGLLELRLSG
jgi:hypothetical protein